MWFFMCKAIDKYDHNLMLVNSTQTYYIIDQSISRIKNKTRISLSSGGDHKI